MLKTPKPLSSLRQHLKQYKQKQSTDNVLSLKNVTTRNTFSSHKVFRRSRSKQEKNVTGILTENQQINQRNYNEYDLTEINDDNGKDLYEGFCIDLLRKISEKVGFDYRIELVPDGKYGVFDYDTGEWNGIVRQLMDKVCK